MKEVIFKNTKRRLILGAIALTLAILLSSMVAVSLANQKVQMSVVQVPDIDIVLAKSNTRVDLTNFEADIMTALEEEGISREKVKVSAIETQDANIQTSFNWTEGTDVSPSIGSISITNSGRNVVMYGNRVNPGKNAIWIIPDGNQDQEFTMGYNIDFGDSFNAAGMLLRVQKTGNVLTGYMLSFNNSNWVSAAGANGAIWEFSYTIGTNSANMTKTLKKALTINKSGTLNVKASDTEIIVSGGGLATPVTYQTEKNFGSGFGFFSDHYSHNCSSIGSFTLTNMQLTTSVVKDFNEVLQQPSWRDGSLRVLVNVTDKIDEQFDNNNQVSSVVSKLFNDDIYYVGWGLEKNQSQIENIIEKNDDKGTFINNTEYTNAIDETATYIRSLLAGIEESPYIIAGEDATVTIRPEELTSGTIDDLWPKGKWKAIQDMEYFENNNGQYELTNIYTDSVISEFNKVGKYEIYYEDELIIPNEVYVHRRPVASFDMKLSNGTLELNSTSYDLDKQSVNNGISEEEWSYKKIDDEEWSTGKLSKVEDETTYIVRLRVKDYQETWSNYETKYIAGDELQAPVASYKIVNSEISKYKKLEVVDASYDPAGLELTAYEWKVENKDGQELYKGTEPLLDYNSEGFGAGEYTMTLTVTNSKGTVSEEFKRTYIITEDVTAPEFVANPLNKESINENIDVSLKFTDEESGVKYYKYGISKNYDEEIIWSDEIYKSVDTIQIAETDNDIYLHIIAVDNAGNESNERIIGPYRVNSMMFDLEIHLTDEENTEVNLGNAKFSLIHPKEDIPNERIMLYGTTDGDGICHIKGYVMGEGTYEYILYETEAPVGYDEVGLVSIQITFNELGEITNVVKKYNDEVELVEYDESVVVLNIGSNKQDKDTFNLEIEVEDEEDSDIKVAGAEYKIISEAATGEKIGITDVTNEDGIIEINKQLSGNGQIVLTLQNTKSKGYIADEEEKVVVLERDRQTGELTFIKWKSDSYINVSVEGETVKVKLKAKKKEVTNKIQVQVMDGSDAETFINGLKVEITDEETGEKE